MMTCLRYLLEAGISEKEIQQELTDKLQNVDLVQNRTNKRKLSEG